MSGAMRSSKLLMTYWSGRWARLGLRWSNGGQDGGEAVEMGLSWEGGRPKTRWRRAGGRKWRAEGRKWRAGGRKGGGKGWKVKKGGKTVEKGGKFETALEHNRSITYWLVACVFGVTLNWGMRVKFQI